MHDPIVLHSDPCWKIVYLTLSSYFSFKKLNLTFTIKALTSIRDLGILSICNMFALE